MSPVIRRMVNVELFHIITQKFPFRCVLANMILFSAKLVKGGMEET